MKLRYDDLPFANRPGRMAPALDLTGHLLRDIPLPIRSQEEVAAIMTARGYPMTQQAVHLTEKRALAKLAAHPLMRRLYDEGLA